MRTVRSKRCHSNVLFSIESEMVKQVQHNSGVGDRRIEGPSWKAKQPSGVRCRFFADLLNGDTP